MFSKIPWIGLLLIFSIVHGSNRSSKDGSPHHFDRSFYHTTDEILQSTKSLATNVCPEVMLHFPVRRGSSDGSYNAETEIVVFTENVRDPWPDDRVRILVSFNEHAREPVTAESGFRLIQLLCVGWARAHGSTGNVLEDDILFGNVGINPPSGVPRVAQWTATEIADTAARILRDVVFILIPVENAVGRKQVENGKSCLRGNGREVDLNRNFAHRWGEEIKSQPRLKEEYPGTKPFSEPETQVIRDITLLAAPHAYIGIHSGIEEMYMPYDSEKKLPSNSLEMQRVLKTINDEYCQCASGPAGSVAGYLAFGTASDWMYLTRNVNFSYTFEIYGDLKAPMRECFRAFNPVSASVLSAYAHRWAITLLALAEELVGSRHVHPDLFNTKPVYPCLHGCMFDDACKSHMEVSGENLCSFGRGETDCGIWSLFGLGEC
eukprot:Rmarinus@m.9298